uniref:A-kinase anchor protein 7-like phosphoesterase domain-containing protein n=1 Tax=Ditylenchus dipsaci TaxID=166011 RepID=A0A915DVJ1_9BILA
MKMQDKEESDEEELDEEEYEVKDSDKEESDEEELDEEEYEVEDSDKEESDEEESDEEEYEVEDSDKEESDEEESDEEEKLVFPHFVLHTKKSKLHIQFHINSKRIQQKVDQVQNELVSADLRFYEFLQSTSTLHVTMLAVNYFEEYGLTRIIYALHYSVKLIRKHYKVQNFQITFDGLSSFNENYNKILYAAVSQKDDSLQKLLDIKYILQHIFVAVGIHVLYNDKEFNPHMTIINIKEPSISDLELVEIWKSTFRSRPCYFGKEKISGFELSVKEYGEYQKILYVPL